MPQARRLGILGGSFDPIHRGHLAMADSALSALKLDLVVFLPDGDPPSKTLHTSADNRLIMLHLATGGNPRYAVSALEMARHHQGYDITCLDRLKADYQADSLFCILGADTLARFPLWPVAPDILKRCQLVVAPRVGSPDISDAIAAIRAMGEGAVHLLPAVKPAVSSRQVRQRLAQGQDIHELVPGPVANYIIKNGLYRQ